MVNGMTCWPPLGKKHLLASAADSLWLLISLEITSTEKHFLAQDLASFQSSLHPVLGLTESLNILTLTLDDIEGHPSSIATYGVG